MRDDPIWIEACVAIFGVWSVLTVATLMQTHKLDDAIYAIIATAALGFCWRTLMRLRDDESNWDGDDDDWR